MRAPGAEQAGHPASLSPQLQKFTLDP